VERALDTHWIGGWVDPRTGLDNVEKRKFLTVPGLQLRPLCRPAYNQSLSRLMEGLGQLKNPLTSFGIEPATFKFVAQCLNQLGYYVPAIEEAELYKTNT
jgi:hypothetical protein